MPDSSLVRIVVTEDEPLVRKGVVTVLQEGGFEVVGVAVDATDLVRKVDQRKPDVVVADIQLPPANTVWPMPRWTPTSPAEPGFR